MTSFFAKLEKRVEEVNSLLCIGLDPHGTEINTDGSVTTAQDKCDAAYTFCKTLIDATLPYAACYKPNAAFFEALGDQGTVTLGRVLKEIPSHVPVLLDVKRGDIGSTASAYAEACYDHLNADAVTLSPLMGWDSVAPFVTGKLLHQTTHSVDDSTWRFANNYIFLFFFQKNMLTRVPSFYARHQIRDRMTCWP
jgi:uridine monophosphate synthetase